MLKKIEAYLAFIHTPEFIKEAGIPSVENTKIVIRIHEASDAKVFELLEKCRDWVCENDARLEVIKRSQ